MFVEFDDLEDGTTEELGDELNARYNALKIGVNAAWKTLGDWDAEYSYAANNVVNYDDAKWLSLRASFNVAPVEGEDWTEIGGDVSSGTTPTGTGIPHVIDGVMQETATKIVNNDIAADAAIEQSKVQGLTADLAGKATSAHTHTAAQITDFATAARDAVNDRTGAPVDTIATLRNVAIADRLDKQTRLVESAGVLYRFDAEGAGSDDGDGVIAPTVGTGRWFKISGAGTSNAATLEGYAGAHYLNRANHTGSQAQSTITNLTSDLAAKQATSEKGQANGYASLGANGRLPLAQRVGQVTLTDAATIALDASAGDRFKCSSAIDRTLGIPSNAIAGQTIVLRWRNTDSNPHTLTLTTTGAGSFRFTQEIDELPAVPAGKWILVGFAYDDDDQKWDVVSRVSGA